MLDQITHVTLRGEEIGGVPEDEEYLFPVLIEGLASPDRPPIVLIHGSPGSASNFDDLVPELNASGRRTVRFDLPGFGSAAPGAYWDKPEAYQSLSAQTHARALLAILRELGIERAHVVGWSNGGAVALFMADMDEHRVASITMLASIGAQETEGSGSHFFEHAKYAVGLAFFGGVLEAVPHFGLFGTHNQRTAWLWNFWDTDQRPAAEIMARLETPTLILHGRHDFLAADWNAERHHQLMPASRLVMIEGSHFIPFLQTKEAGEIMLAHFARHDSPGVAPLTGYDDRAPRPERDGLAAAWDWIVVHARGVHWLAWIAIIGPLAWLWPRVTTVLAALLVAAMTLDFGVATAGLWAAALAGVVLDPVRRARLGPWLAALLRPLVALTFVWLLAHWNILESDDGLLGIAFALDGLGLFLALPLGVLALAVTPKLLTPSGWRSLRNSLVRARNHEWWPIWAIYLPLVPYLLSLAARRRSLLAFTAANPGMSHAGGWVGESKAEILDGLKHAGAAVMPAAIIEPGPPPGARAEQALARIESRAELGGLPIILKPDVGQNGADVKLARTPEDVRRYFQQVHERVIVQRYHPGPCEAGVFWIRDVRWVAADPPRGEPAGRIYSITRKTLPEVVGDGRRSVRRLVLAHPRARLQAGALLAQLGDRANEIPADGEAVRVGQVGNHCRGAMFSDGADLITPALERAIDAVARNFAGIGGGPLDIGRFDVRYRDEDSLRRGEDLGVIELNGAGAEATNYYDPDRSVWWAWRVLAGQWRAAFELGAAREKLGARPVSLPRFVLMALGWVVWRRRGASGGH